MLPATSVTLAGVMVIEVKVTAGGAVTVNPVLPVTEPEAAVIVTLPAETPVAKPDALTVAIAELVEVQVTELVRFAVVPLL